MAPVEFETKRKRALSVCVGGRTELRPVEQMNFGHPSKLGDGLIVSNTTLRFIRY